MGNRKYPSSSKASLTPLFVGARRAVLFIIAMFLLAALPAPLGAQPSAREAPAPKTPRAIVLGFDGIDPELCQTFMDQGHLPNMKALADKGDFVPLHTMNPPQSPVCWSSMLTGLRPEKHGVTGFVRRVPGTYSPELGIIRVEERSVLGGLPGHIALGLALALVVGGATAGFLRLIGYRGRKRLPALLASALAGIGAAHVLSMLPLSIPVPVNARTGKTFFELVAAQGHTVAALNAPMDWPVSSRPNVIEYAGFEVPDLRGTFGIYSYYTTEFSAAEFEVSEMGADVRRVRFEARDGSGEYAQTILYGARDLTRKERGYPAAQVPLKLRRDGGKLGIRFGKGYGVDDRAITLASGQWSEWVTLTFTFNALVRVSGRARFYVESVTPELRLFATPVEFDPYEPAGGYQLANPPSFAKEVEELVEGMDTLGWPEMTHSLYDDNIEDATFMKHLLELEEKRATVLRHILDRGDRDLVCAWFFGSDRVQHMMWRYIDPDNPAYASLQASPLRDSILDIYRFMDRVVGDVMKKHMGERTLLMVLSDHGFAPFRRAVSINRWLVDQGYLVLKGPQRLRRATDMFFERDSLLTEVDWERTKAYAMGLGKIFINLRGREPLGRVEPGERDALAREIAARLEKMEDPEHPGAVVVSRAEVIDPESGPYAEELADILVGFARGYRVSWQTTLGYANEPVVFTNSNRWSGDHCSIDPALIPGILFCNRTIASKRLSLLTIAPTVLREFGIESEETLDAPPAEFGAARIEAR